MAFYARVAANLCRLMTTHKIVETKCCLLAIKVTAPLSLGWLFGVGPTAIYSATRHPRLSATEVM
jgi:hypothetical protein